MPENKDLTPFDPLQDVRRNRTIERHSDVAEQKLAERIERLQSKGDTVVIVRRYETGIIGPATRLLAARGAENMVGGMERIEQHLYPVRSRVRVYVNGRTQTWLFRDDRSCWQKS
jgi:hypothetical protein